ncbi:hypothetical protein V7S43_018396 [Phytophthora oleae]|uniref:Uncharacterized protein n=1 Tax=Phytophthora oleae TaxID=2107226 RepID=A0ABD3EQL7_9STRA
MVPDDDQSETADAMMEILKKVASGKAISFDKYLLDQTTAVEILTKLGVLYESEANQLQFTSNMHLKIWLSMNRTNPSRDVLPDISKDDLVIACVQEMSASRLLKFATKKSACETRERRIQMELYNAITRCVAKEVLVTPE